MYYILKEGVYVQGVWSGFDTLEEAVNVADTLAKNDKDDYHVYTVVSKVAKSLDLFTSKAIYNVRKGKEGKYGKEV